MPGDERAPVLHGPLFGIDALYGMDLYARRPLVVHLELHAGSLGSAFVGQARAAIGVQLWTLELYAGYDHTVVMGESKAKLGGPVVGGRAWFLRGVEAPYAITSVCRSGADGVFVDLVSVVGLDLDGDGKVDMSAER